MPDSCMHKLEERVKIHMYAAPYLVLKRSDGDMFRIKSNSNFWVFPAHVTLWVWFIEDTGYQQLLARIWLSIQIDLEQKYSGAQVLYLVTLSCERSM